ncbi:MAG: hypothetical protein QXZ20_01675, partial [Candidatus Aenigmatarchaeota archaeon]
IVKHYQNAIGLLREDIRKLYPEITNSSSKDDVKRAMRSKSYRSSGKEILLSQPHLLDRSSETLESTIQQLYYIGLNYNNINLLGSKPATKREKMAWMLRELFDYGYNKTLEEKREVIENLYYFLRDRPYLLTCSIPKLEKNKDNLKALAQKYKK